MKTPSRWAIASVLALGVVSAPAWVGAQTERFSVSELRRLDASASATLRLGVEALASGWFAAEAGLLGDDVFSQALAAQVDPVLQQAEFVAETLARQDAESGARAVRLLERAQTLRRRLEVDHALREREDFDRRRRLLGKTLRELARIARVPTMTPAEERELFLPPDWQPPPELMDEGLAEEAREMATLELLASIEQAKRPWLPVAEHARELARRAGEITPLSRRRFRDLALQVEVLAENAWRAEVERRDELGARQRQVLRQTAVELRVMLEHERATATAEADVR